MKSFSPFESLDDAMMAEVLALDVGDGPSGQPPCGDEYQHLTEDDGTQPDLRPDAWFVRREMWRGQAGDDGEKNAQLHALHRNCRRPPGEIFTASWGRPAIHEPVGSFQLFLQPGGPLVGCWKRYGDG